VALHSSHWRNHSLRLLNFRSKSLQARGPGRPSCPVVYIESRSFADFRSHNREDVQRIRTRTHAAWFLKPHRRLIPFPLSPPSTSRFARHSRAPAGLAGTLARKQCRDAIDCVRAPRTTYPAEQPGPESLLRGEKPAGTMRYRGPPLQSEIDSWAAGVNASLATTLPSSSSEG
jgi:hypothetical protein